MTVCRRSVRALELGIQALRHSGGRVRFEQCQDRVPRVRISSNDDSNDDRPEFVNAAEPGALPPLEPG